MKQHRGDENKLGWALQLTALRYLGFCPNDLQTVPASIVSYLAGQVGVEPQVLANYGQRDKTRTQHTREVQEYLGYREATENDLKELAEWLLKRALEHDRPITLLGLATQKLHTAKVVRPGITRLAQLVDSAREKATLETYRLLAPLLTEERILFLDGLLKANKELGSSRLEWLRQGATANSSKFILENLTKLDFLREAGVDTWQLTGLNPNRRKFLTQVGRKSTPYLLSRLKTERRLPILLAFVVQSYEDIIDETLDLFIGYLEEANSRAINDLEEFRLNKARAMDEKVRHFQALGSFVLSEEIVGDKLRESIFQYLPRAALEAAVEECTMLVRPIDNTHYDFLLKSYKAIRHFSPRFLAAFTFHSNVATAPLLQAIKTLCQFNASRKKHLSDHSTLPFVPGKWMNYVLNPNGSINKEYYELAVLWELRAALRSANVWVTGSRRYATLESYLIPREQWPGLRPEVCRQLGITEDGAKQLNLLAAELETAMTKLEQRLGKEETKVRIEEGKFVLSSLEASGLPKRVSELQHQINQRLPWVELIALLIEVDSWTKYSDCFVHASGHELCDAEAKAHLYIAILTQACNFSLARMEKATDFTEERLAYYTHWYLREETLRPAITKLVNFQHHQPLARHWGNGTLSSSDGQRFPVALSNRKAKALPKYFGYGKGLPFYTWTSDENSQYGSKPTVSTDRDALYILDEILNNETELPLYEHTSDTAGSTHIIFALFSLLGLQFSPRIRDMGEQRLYRLGRLKEHPVLKPLIKNLLKQRVIVKHYDELLRITGSLKLGYVTASLLISKLQSLPQKNAMAQALEEYGKLVETIFILRYYESEEYQHRIEAQLNKGEGLHALREVIFFANRGQLRKRQLEAQANQASCLNLVTNAVVIWNTVYMTEILEQLKTGNQPPEEVDYPHLSPTRSEHVNPYGRYQFNMEEELGRTKLRELL
ncbi:Tn3 family transposase [Candidatus Chlorohelix allophototropha]|uniref:Tn3 family transposase n=1 Tax=Candidatus Chlorohelix allophototropha TaxID=3003348 RepID=A0ABY9B485_9CHLR|nr:Tn3 family transposase [Chloroflexota bacterium L227-S17]